MQYIYDVVYLYRFAILYFSNQLYCTNLHINYVKKDFHNFFYLGNFQRITGVCLSMCVFSVFADHFKFIAFFVDLLKQKVHESKV